MKKILLTAAMMLATCSLYFASAQDAQKPERSPEQKAEFKARKIANTLLLSDDSTNKFVPIYKAYKLELNAINKKYRREKRSEDQKGTPLSDDEVDTIIRNGFAKSKEILDVRVTYYEKFLKVLTPKQIKKMYDDEKNAADMAVHHRWEKKHGGKDECNGHRPQGQHKRHDDR